MEKSGSKIKDDEYPPVVAVAVSGGGERIAIARRNRRLDVYDGRGRLVATHSQHKIPISEVIISQDGTSVVSLSKVIKRGFKQELISWVVGDALPVTHRPFFFLSGYESLVMLPGQNRFLVDSNEFLVFEVGKPNEISSLSRREYSSEAIAVSPNAKKIALAQGDNEILIVDFKSGILNQVLKGHQDRVDHVAFSDDGRLLGSSSRDQTIRIWDIATGETIRCYESNADKVFHFDFHNKAKCWFQIDRNHGCRSFHQDESEPRQHNLLVESNTSAVGFDRLSGTVAVGDAKGTVKMRALHLSGRKGDAVTRK